MAYLCLCMRYQIVRCGFTNCAFNKGILAVCLIILFTVTGVSGSWAAEPLESESDFHKIARGGFRHTVNGNFPSLSENIGSGRNSYAWSMEWYDVDGVGPEPHALFVGTVRDVLCNPLPVNPSPLTDCPFSLSPLWFGTEQRAEIWRYDPSPYAELGGANGSWTRVYQAPSTPFTGSLFDDVPRDIGYRNQSVCETYGDNRERLYVTTSGVPGNILYINDLGTDFLTTSTTGLKADQAAYALFSSVSSDIGYRGLACFNGYIITSPASSTDSSSPDVSENPFLLGNWNPSGGEPWTTLIDFRNFPSIDFAQDGDFSDPEDTDNGPVDLTMGDPSNYGAFDMRVMDGDLWVAVSNRGENGGPDRGGVEVWRGDGADFGTECNTFNPLIANDGCAGISWNKVIDVGAGRRPDSFGPAIDNALGTFGILDGSLYVAMWESGFADASLAELIRIDPGSGPGDESWELLIGGGRLDYAAGYGTATGTMTCDAANEYQDQTGADTPFPIDGLVGDAGDRSDCYPATGRNAGFGPVQTVGQSQYHDSMDADSIPDLIAPGIATYFWRLGPHLNSETGNEELFVSTFTSNAASSDLLDVPVQLNFSEGGFDLIKTSSVQQGREWTIVTSKGFGNPLNYGLRSIFSVQLPDAPPNQPVLFMGTANPYAAAPNIPGTAGYWGGTEIFMGTGIPVNNEICFVIPAGVNSTMVCL